MDSEKIKQIAQTVDLAPAQVVRVLDEAIKAGLVRPTAPAEAPPEAALAKEFAAVKESILTRDIYAAARRARHKSHRLEEFFAISWKDFFATKLRWQKKGPLDLSEVSIDTLWL